MKLVIAEKPSVAMALASVIGARTRKDGYVEGNGYIVSWCVGHLVGLCDASEYDEKYKKWRYDDLPIVPECWKHKVLEGTKKQFGILKKLMRDSKVDEVICATDAGREGELIFRLVYEQAGCKKPMKRLWISSMEEQAIKDGFASLKDGSCYDSLYQSALCRARELWTRQVRKSEDTLHKEQTCLVQSDFRIPHLRQMQEPRSLRIFYFSRSVTAWWSVSRTGYIWERMQMALQ